MKQNTKESFTKEIFMRMIPSALASSFGWAFSDMADAVVVGQRLGVTGLAAISLILPVYMINCVMAHALGAGGSVSFSADAGCGNTQEATKNFNNILMISLIFSFATAILGNLFINPLLAVLGTRPEDGMLFTSTKSYLRVLLLASPLFYVSNILNYYLRNDQNQKLAGYGSVIGNIFDIALNITLVMLLNLGTFGAALSTAIGQVIAILIYIPGVTKKANLIKIKFQKIEWKKGLHCFLNGFSISIQYLYQLIFQLICNNMLIRMSGETGVAVFDLIQNTSYLLLYLYEGVSRSMQPLVSTFHGEKNQIAEKSTFKLSLQTGMGIGTLLILALELFPQGMCALFGISDSNAISIGTYALRLYGISAFFAGINILVCNYYQAVCVEKLSYVVETLRGFIVLLPVTLVCVKLGIWNFWWVFLITEVISFILFLLLRKQKQFKINTIDSSRVFTTMMEATQDELVKVNQSLEEITEQWECSMKQQYFINMTVEELGLLFIDKCQSLNRKARIQITIVYLENGDCELHFMDNLVTFNPFSLNTDKRQEKEEIDMDTVGIKVIKKKAKSFFYRRYHGYNVLFVKI